MGLKPMSQGAAGLGLVALLFAALAGPALAVPLTREENARQLEHALTDPAQAFVQWAHRHRRPYLAGAPPALLSQLLLTTPTSTSTAGTPTGSGSISSSSSSSTARLGFSPLLALEYASRQRAFEENARYAQQYNAAVHAHGGTHWLGLNGLADLSFEEYRRLLGTRPALRHPSSASSSSSAPQLKGKGLGQRQEAAGQKQYAGEEAELGLGSRLGSGRVPGFMYDGVDLASLPKGVDWRNHSAVSEVKNQAMCGSCWAFATTGAIEGINAIRTHKLVSLSEQELVDCDRDVDQGCSGGMMDNAYEWIIQNRGLASEEDWPYTGQESPEGCDDEKRVARRVVTIDGYQDVPVGDESALLRAVAHQPVAVAVEADSRAFQLYMGGVMSDPGCGAQLNHGVLVVGYGGLEPPGSSPPADPALGPYWIVKNSWGPTWGVEGYINLQMGFKDEATGMAGICGITLAASFPIKHGPNPPTPPPAPPTPPPKPAPPPPPPAPPKPKPHPPGPVQCDELNACPAQSTCCCMDDPSAAVLQLQPRAAAGGAQSLVAPPLKPNPSRGCAIWGCCPISDAICCADRLHCCPPELPVCDTDAGRCLPQAGAGKGGVPFGGIAWLPNSRPIRSAERTRSSSAKPTSAS